MKKLTSNATFFIATCALFTGAQCQEVFRCGDSYSQKPCANAVVVNVDDARSPAQKTQADAATRRELATADAMEKARLKEEAQLRERNVNAARTQAMTASKPKATTKIRSRKNPKKEKEPEYFKALPADKKPKAATSTKK